MLLNVAQKASWSQIVGGMSIGLTGLTAVGLHLRQRELRGHPVCASASQQLKASDAVRGALCGGDGGGASVLVNGPIGGYIDPSGGTAVLTLPLTARRGDTTGRGLARVEAEGAWLSRKEGFDDRWLLRHLEVTREGAADEAPTVLYSLPPTAPLPPWAPSRESAVPHDLRAYFPDFSFFMQTDEGRKVAAALAAVVAMNAAAFAVLRGRVGRVATIRPVESALKIEPTPKIAALLNRALTAAQPAGGGELALLDGSCFGGGVRAAAPAARRGAVVAESKAEVVALYAPLSTPKDLLVRAQHAGGGEWTLTHVGLQDAHATEDALDGVKDADPTTVREAVSAMVSRAPNLLRQAGPKV